MRAIPLTKTNRVKIARAFRQHHRYDAVLDSVIEGQMGKAYTNNIEDLELLRVAIEPFHYFAGDSGHEDALTFVKALKPNSFILPTGEGWWRLIHEVFGQQVLVMNRFLYSAEALNPRDIDIWIAEITPIGQIHRIDSKRSKSFFEDNISMIYLNDYESGQDFYERSLGFVMEYEGKVIGAAYAPIVSGTKAQIALYVSHAYRKRGIATILALHFIRLCLENNIEPVWVANNQETCKLAERLGFLLTTPFQVLFLSEG